MTSDEMAPDELAVPGLNDTTLADLIRLWTERLADAHEAYPLADRATMKSYLDMFVRGGGDAIGALIRRGPWVQVSVSMPRDDASARRLLSRGRQLVGTLFSEALIENFFFMSKPPGLRLRFEAIGGVAGLTNRIKSELSDWRAEGLIDVELYGVYEPESRLFGGPRSIAHVHALFTLDSLVWLEYHSYLATRRDPNIDAWNVSFTILRALFDGLSIVGWEELGVWEHIVERTGRRLPPGVATLLDYSSLESAVLAAWEGDIDWTSRVGHGLPQDSVLTTCHNSIRATAARWKADYFDRADAWIGPRRAAAYVTIFHWNRAGFSGPQQALIAETLASRGRSKTSREV